MTRELLFAAAVAGVALGCAVPVLAAAPASLEPAFSGTIVSTYPDGRQGKLWLNADGSYTAEGRRHKPSSGKWTLKGERICLKQSKPPTVPFASYCTQVPSGTSWSAKAVTGEPIKVKLVLGGRA